MAHDLRLVTRFVKAAVLEAVLLKFVYVHENLEIPKLFFSSAAQYLLLSRRSIWKDNRESLTSTIENTPPFDNADTIGQSVELQGISPKLSFTCNFTNLNQNTFLGGFLLGVSHRSRNVASWFSLWLMYEKHSLEL